MTTNSVKFEREDLLRLHEVAVVIVEIMTRGFDLNIHEQLAVLHMIETVIKKTTGIVLQNSEYENLIDQIVQETIDQITKEHN